MMELYGREQTTHTASDIGVNAIGLLADRLMLSIDPDGACNIAFEAEPGLYQLTVIADAGNFDWEQLYVNLNAFGNHGERTGPWDFHPTEGNRALVPSYWTELDDENIGLWYFQRVSLDDLAHKRFRGRMAFHVAAGGTHRLKLRPYKSYNIRWVSVLLENDPEDKLGPVPPMPDDWADRCPAAKWRDAAWWAKLKEKLQGDGRCYEEPLHIAFKWADDPSNRKPENVPLLLARYFLTDDRQSLETAIEIIDAHIAMEHWGNPLPDGYGHDGDMNAMLVFWGLTLSYHYLRDLLDDGRKERLLDKLTLQGKRFFAKVLLYRDYWGGSVLQDHGWKSLHGFGCAALHLLGVIPEAELWTAYIIPRLERCRNAMPVDGVIPGSSHFHIHLYVGFVGQYRDALLALTGEDMYQDDKFRRIVDFLTLTVYEEDSTVVSYGKDMRDFVGALEFLNAMAALHRDGRAVYLHDVMLKAPPKRFYSKTLEHAYYTSILWGLFSYDPRIEPEPPRNDGTRFGYFEDSGSVYFRDRTNGLVFSAQCGPAFGYHAYRTATGPCDRLGGGPDAGHFMIALQGKPLLTTPDSGYKLQTAIRSCLLVDGVGQKDDIGYPMSVPSYRYHGEHIQYVRWNERAGSGRIALELTPAYGEEAGIASYVREFVIEQGGVIVLRDKIVMDRKRRLSWLFQTRRVTGLRIEGTACTIGSSPSVRLEPRSVSGARLALTVEETPVVWGYSSAGHYNPYDTVRYDTEEEVSSAVVDFVFTVSEDARSAEHV